MSKNMTKGKEYLIKLFLKRCTIQSLHESHLDFSFQLFTNTYDVAPEKLEELKRKYTQDKYIERIIPLIDKQFTEDELREAIKFYSSPVGRKIMDRHFLMRIGDESSRMFAEIEQEFALNNIEK